MFKCIDIKTYASIILLIFSPITLAIDYAVETNSVFIEHRRLNNQFIASVESGDIEGSRLKRSMVEAHRKSAYTPTLHSLEKKFCADPRLDVLDEFLATLLNTANSASEYPSFVFARLFSCQPDMIVNKIISLKVTEKSSVVNTLKWGFKNITYNKEDVFPNFQSLSDSLNKMTLK